VDDAGRPDGDLTETGEEGTFTLLPAGWMPPSGRVGQCLGLCFTDDGRVVLIEQGGYWSLPGGTVEPGEALAETLAREVREEACATVLASKYLASQLVSATTDPAGRHYQARWWARVRLERWDARFETTARRLVDPAELVSEISWTQTGILQRLLVLALAADAEHRRGTAQAPGSPNQRSR
jgi:ADP-ribose pyrophosphatase YjhB (NUDIX family)